MLQGIRNIFPVGRRKSIPVSKKRQTRASILLIILLFITFITHPLYAAKVELTAEVDNPNPTVGSRFTYTLTISGGTSLPDAQPPDFEGFDIVMGPSSSTSFQMINGKVSHSKTLTYVLRALKPGTFTIGKAKAKSKRKIYRSNAIAIQVRQSGSSPITTQKRKSKDNKSVPKKSLPDLFLTATADKDTAYKQEMVLVTYRLYLRVNIVGFEYAKLPKARGFWQEEFSTPSRPTLQDVTVRGQPYKVAVMRKIGLFPTRTGKLTLEPLILDCTVELPSSRRRQSRDIFDSFFSRTQRENRSVSCDPLTLTVLDLPKRKRPVNFKGDVGKFRLKVDYDKRQLAQHDALTVKVTIRGNGYLKSIDAPKLKLPSGFEQFDPTVDEKITLSGNEMKGKKSFTYLVIPRRSGAFDMEPVKFSYFDPTLKKYKTVRDGGITLTVTPSEDDIAGGGWTERLDVALLDSDIRFIKELSAPLTATVTPIYNSIWFYLALGAAPLLFLLGLGTEAVIIKRLSDPAALRRRKAPEMMRKNLIEAKKEAKRGNLGQAIEIAGQGLMEFTGAIIATPTAGLTSDTIRDKLRQVLTPDATTTKLNVKDEFVNEIIATINESDRIKFSSAELDVQTTETLLDRFKEASEQLEKLR
ncbi:MAG: BatD family protein [Candidatus Hatepunaea meridiana]|nr:BatD family protein [Candidatus Hatepunaea meridiana]